MTLNKPEDPKEASMEIYGYILVSTSACLYGGLFVVLRKMNLYNINMVISPLYFGIGTLLQNVFILIFTNDLLHYSSYDKLDYLCLSIVCIGCTIGQFTMISANKYAAASKMAPISYAENVITILADVLIFNYHFILTDVAGMGIIIT